MFLIPQKASALTFNHIVISEFSTATIDSASQEFVELHNPSDQPIRLDGWALQYKAASGETWNNKANLTGKIEPRGYYLIATGGYLDGISSAKMGSGLAAAGGHIRIASPGVGTEAWIQNDLVGWGSALQSEGGSALAPSSNQSSKRHVDEDAKLVDSDNNATDFFLSDIPSPNASDPIDESDDSEVPVDPVKTYLPIDITEIFADPVSPQSDASDEFVELYNPNLEPVNLGGYVLQTGSSFNYNFTLPDIELAVGQYLAIASSDSHLTLSNSGGNARILDPDGKQKGIAEEYSNAKPAEAWAKFNEGWAWTEKSTPGATNELVVSIDEASLPSGDSKSITACRSDQFRNPETNRCKLKSSSTGSLTPCKPGQVRSVETNRCRASTSSGSSAKPCAADQFRNPETNRCKKLSSASSSLKACDEGQERSRDTNRCRKVSAGAADMTDAAAVLSTDKVKQNLPLIAVIGGGSVIYALYEFRYDIRNNFKKARGYIGSRTTSGRDP
jgi:hypothetical protein